MEELKENFDEWIEAFESKGMRANLGKPKLMLVRWSKKRSSLRLVLVACVKQELCLTW